MTTQPTEGLIAELEMIDLRIGEAKSDHICEDAQRLELYHDRLVDAVRDLNGTLLAFLRASQEQPQ